MSWVCRICSCFSHLRDARNNIPDAQPITAEEINFMRLSASWSIMLKYRTREISSVLSLILCINKILHDEDWTYSNEYAFSI